MIKIQSDGSCRDYKGSWAFVVLIDDKISFKRGHAVSIKTTHNRMEYMALQNALEYAKEHYPKEEVYFYTDSELAVRQLTLQSEVGKVLAPFWQKCMPILDDYPNFILTHASRKEVGYAHTLAATIRNIEHG